LGLFFCTHEQRKNIGMLLRGSVGAFVAVSLMLFLPACAQRDTDADYLRTQQQKAVTVSTAVHQSAFDTKIVVRGRVREVCPDDGCWIVLTDGANVLRVEPQNSEEKDFSLIPTESEVLVEGKLLSKIILPTSKGFKEYEKACGTTAGTSSTQIKAVILIAEKFASQPEVK
jgi:light-regulated signal transduction histidine kinase (bacteriophytochrome)